MIWSSKGLIFLLHPPPPPSSSLHPPPGTCHHVEFVRNAITGYQGSCMSPHFALIFRLPIWYLLDRHGLWSWGKRILIWCSYKKQRGLFMTWHLCGNFISVLIYILSGNVYYRNWHNWWGSREVLECMITGIYHICEATDGGICIFLQKNLNTY